MVMEWETWMQHDDLKGVILQISARFDTTANCLWAATLSAKQQKTKYVSISVKLTHYLNKEVSQ